MIPPVKTVFIIGPTATGKTMLGVQLAHRFNGEIVSADSRQVYRGLDIGTGKDLDEYTQVDPPIQYHLIDVADPNDEYNVHRFSIDAQTAITDINARNHLPVVVGGTPLYVKALIEDYELEGGPPDPELRKQLKGLDRGQLIDKLQEIAPDRLDKTDLTQRPRIIRAIEIAATTGLVPVAPTIQADAPRTSSSACVPASPGNAGSQTKISNQPPKFNVQRSTFNVQCSTFIAPLLIAPYYPRKTVHERIEKRLDQRLENGMIEEVESLHQQGVSWERLEYLGLEYRYIALYLQEKLTRQELRDQLLVKIRRFCKAQDVWYRKFERDGWDIHWIPEGEVQTAAELVDAFVHDRHIPIPKIRLDNITYGPRSQ